MLRNETNLLKNLSIFTTITVASIFSVVLCQAYLKPNAHYAIGTVDALTCLVFAFVCVKLQLRTILLISFPMQAIFSFTLAMILLLTKNEDTKQGFESLTGFSNTDEVPQDTLWMIGTSEASMYTLVLLVRFFGMVSLLSSC